MVNRRNLGLTYAGVTFALVAAISASGWCWGTVNPFDVSVGLKQICIAIWALSGTLLGLSQIAFLVIAIRMKQYVVVVFAGCIVLAIAVFVFALSRIPS
jgi:hypothetical protein